MRTSLFSRQEGETEVEVLDVSPNGFAVELRLDGNTVKTVNYPTELAARVESAVALRWPADYAKYGALKDWPNDARKAAHL